MLLELRPFVVLALNAQQQSSHSMSHVPCQQNSRVFRLKQPFAFQDIRAMIGHNLLRSTDAMSQHRENRKHVIASAALHHFAVEQHNIRMLEYEITALNDRMPHPHNEQALAATCLRDMIDDPDP